MAGSDQNGWSEICFYKVSYSLNQAVQGRGVAVITVKVTASARYQHQPVTRNQKAARQHSTQMTVELVDEINALVDEAQCCRDVPLGHKLMRLSTEA
jgi:hypothetical protein